ncbi:MAG: cupin domain-containing protein [Cytophagales bacterium]|nr:cupin domain-containing protein [Cytophagales bacterium]
MNAINLQEKFKKFNTCWHPYIVAELNTNYVKVARLEGEFVWHKHEAEDELFVVLEGTLMMDFKDKTVTVKPGEILVVPKGVEHRPWTTEEVKIMLVEPKSTLHTGDLVVEQTVTKQDWI